MSATIDYPGYIRVVERISEGWNFYSGKVFYRPSGATLNIRNPEPAYGLTKEKVTIELFKVNGGCLGFYVANLRDRRYYYCGVNREDVKTTLRSLGIGRDDPLESSNNPL